MDEASQAAQQHRGAETRSMRHMRQISLSDARGMAPEQSLQHAHLRPLKGGNVGALAVNWLANRFLKNRIFQRNFSSWTMTRKNLDAYDRKILRSLQADATLSLDRIAEIACLSATACWRRVKRLEEEKIIEGRVTLLSQRALGLMLTGYVMIRTDAHSDDWLERFSTLIHTMDEVVEFHRMTGDVDYLLKIVTPDLESYDLLYRKLIRIPGIRDVSASFSMEKIKATTALPLGFA